MLGGRRAELIIPARERPALHPTPDLLGSRGIEDQVARVAQATAFVLQPASAGAGCVASDGGHASQATSVGGRKGATPGAGRPSGLRCLREARPPRARRSLGTVTAARRRAR